MKVKKRNIHIVCEYFLLLLTNITVCFAAPPPDNNLKGNLIFLGVNHNSSRSVWLSLTNAAGSFMLEGPGKQLIDEWSLNQRGLRLSLSPIVSEGNGGTHHLINSANNKALDTQNQKGGVVFPPFLPSQPGIPTHPIFLPGSPPVSGTPIPGVPTQIPANVSQSSTIDSSVERSFDNTTPITPSRQFEEEKLWNIWSDNYYYGIRDGRNDINTHGDATNFTIGADKYITNNLVGGFSLSTIQLDTKAYNGLENYVKGYKGGPYLGYQISKTWAVDGSINYGQVQNNNTILSLNSQYITKLANATLHATGLYQFGDFNIKPQPLITYTYFRNPTYDFNGTILNTPVQITREAEHFALGYAEFKIEGNYTKEVKNGDFIQPYTEIGIDYAFVRPSYDQIYSGNLALANIPKTSGLFTLGLRSMIANKLLVQASSSYLSIGQSNYDAWDARLLISYTFD